MNYKHYFAIFALFAYRFSLFATRGVDIPFMPAVHKGEFVICDQFLVYALEPTFHCLNTSEFGIPPSKLTTPYDLVKPQRKSWFAKWPDVFFTFVYDDLKKKSWYDVIDEDQPNIRFVENPFGSFIKNGEAAFRFYHELQRRIASPGLYESIVISRIAQKGNLLLLFAVPLTTRKEILIATIDFKKNILIFDHRARNTYFNNMEPSEEELRYDKQIFYIRKDIMHLMGYYAKAIAPFGLAKEPAPLAPTTHQVQKGETFYFKESPFCSIYPSSKKQETLYALWYFVWGNGFSGWLKPTEESLFLRKDPEWGKWSKSSPLLFYDEAFLPWNGSLHDCIFYNPDLPNGYADLAKYPRFRVTASKLNVREKPTTKSKVLFLAPKGTIVFQLKDTGIHDTYEGYSDTWRKIRLLNGVVGYVFGAYLE
ncbi:MAG: SH3 domain-containing protein [Candidatus Hydrogenedentota bacterium]|nr:MAG: SH3 domain-containing protein [Candidatus Hydrogenedentota bacterium]